MLAAVLLQVTWLPHLPLLGADPNLALLAVVSWTWIRGPRAGLTWALAAGLLLDLTSSGALGVHAIALMAAAYAAGLISTRLHDGRVLLPAATSAVASLVYGVIVVGASVTLGQPLYPPGVARALLLGGAVYSAVLMPPVLLLLTRVESLLPAPGGVRW